MIEKAIIDFINTNKIELKNYPNTTFQIEDRIIDSEDKIGYEYLIFFSDKSAFLIGECEVFNENENTIEFHCFDYYQKRIVSPSEIINKFKTYLNLII
ncbi:hypothetical protein [Flavobacterium daejeonense]|uniref:hypothetical protein n=1 Tax=Flavobacterium daejeonense TaxID=350893 RepID=UPI00047A7B45|nr:hypothetical protein [Flavobacterium daejeonense]